MWNAASSCCLHSQKYEAAIAVKMVRGILWSRRWVRCKGLQLVILESQVSTSFCECTMGIQTVPIEFSWMSLANKNCFIWNSLNILYIFNHAFGLILLHC